MTTLFFQPSIAAIPPLTISSDQIIDDLVIDDRDLIIEKGVTVTVKGTLSIKGYTESNPDCIEELCSGPNDGRLINYGTINNEGSIMIFSDASFVNYGVVNNLGIIDVACTGIFSNEGELLGTEIRICDKSSFKEEGLDDFVCCSPNPANDPFFLTVIAMFSVAIAVGAVAGIRRLRRKKQH